MGLREELTNVGSLYLRARAERFTEHPIATALRRHVVAAMIEAAGEVGAGYTFKGSAGAGQWAEIPWAAVFDPIVTGSATGGFYPVYLFDPAANRIHLSMNQGTTAVRSEFRGLTLDVLAKRASLIRSRLLDFRARFPAEAIDLLDAEGLAADYVAGHALGITYDTNSLPSEAALTSDLRAILECYRSLIFRGGLDFDVTGSAGADATEPAVILEQRRYKLHRRIERNRKASKQARDFHGTVCQACDLDFSARYGTLGLGFIEVHHLVSLSSLDAGATRSFNVATDFAVLCANCHRMIHRMPTTDDVAALRKLVAN